MVGFPPKSSILNRVFYYKPSILGYPCFWNIHMVSWHIETFNFTHIHHYSARGSKKICSILLLWKTKNLGVGQWSITQNDTPSKSSCMTNRYNQNTVSHSYLHKTVMGFQSWTPDGWWVFLVAGKIWMTWMTQKRFIGCSYKKHQKTHSFLDMSHDIPIPPHAPPFHLSLPSHWPW